MLDFWTISSREIGFSTLVSRKWYRNGMLAWLSQERGAFSPRNPIKKKV